MAIGGVALKSVSLFLRVIQFCCAAIVFSIFVYFLATLKNHDFTIATYIRAVTGISGAAVLYTIIGFLFVCCLGGIAFFSTIAMLLDLAFTGAFAYIVYATRDGRNSCRGNVSTPFGSGDTNTNNDITSPNGDGRFTVLPSLRTACNLNKACFAVAIVGMVFFFLTIFVEFGLIRHRRKERAFGPSPNNGYTAGSPKRKFWQRKPKHNRDLEKNPDALPAHSTPADVRTSYATDNTAVGSEVPVNKYGNTAAYGNQTGGVTGGTHAPVNGYQTTTTTHVPHNGYERTHQPYNANPTANF